MVTSYKYWQTNFQWGTRVKSGSYDLRCVCFTGAIEASTSPKARSCGTLNGCGSPPLFRFLYVSDSQTVLTTIQNWFWWTEDLATQASNSVCKIWWFLWMMFASKLRSSFLFQQSTLKYLRYRQTKKSDGNVKNIQPRFGTSRRDPYFDPSRPLFGPQLTPWESLLYVDGTQRHWAAPKRVSYMPAAKIVVVFF